MKSIKIESVSEDKTEYGNKVTIQSGKEKYIFYSTKKDGGVSKAYEQLKKYRFGVGDVVSVETDEKEKSFTNKEGKNVTYTERKILYFQEQDNLPVVETKPVQPFEGTAQPSEINQILARLTALENWRTKMTEGRVADKRNEEGEDVPF